MSRGVRGGTGLVRIGRRRRFFGSPREGFPILGIVDRDARAIAVRLFRAQDPPGLFGRSRRALGRTSSSSWATLTESSSASDRDTTSTLRAPPSPKWAHTSMSFFALMAREARRSRAEPSRRRVSDPAESEERAKRRTTLAAVRVCAALRTVTARQTLPKIFRRRSLLPSGKLGGSFAVSQATRCFFRLRQRSPVSSGHHIVRRPRRERLSASTRGRRDTTMRIYTPAEVRPEPPPTHPRDAPLTRQARETSRTQKRRCRPRASRAESGFLRSTRDRSR